jgi:serine/threonine-protein kinase RsbW
LPREIAGRRPDPVGARRPVCGSNLSIGRLQVDKRDGQHIEVNEQMVAQVVLKLTGPMDHLRLVWQTGEALLESVAFEDDPEGTRYNILLAVQEMVTNVLRHAYDFDDSQPVEVVFDLKADAVEISLRDRGPEFDPLQHDLRALANPEEMPIETGGYGIYIARMVMDDVVYERHQGWNEVRMRKLVRRGVPTENQ